MMLAVAFATAALVFLTASLVNSAPLPHPTGPVPAVQDKSNAPLADASLVCGSESGYRFAGPRGVAFDRQHGEILVTNGPQHSVDVFDLGGRLLSRIPHRVLRGNGAAIDGEPRWVALDSAGRMLLTDTYSPSLEVLDRRGNSLRHIALCNSDGSEPDSFPGPVIVLEGGTIAVASRGAHGRIYFISPRYEPLGSWGTSGTEPGQLSWITGLAATPGGDLVMTGGNTRNAVQVFDRQGKFLLGFGAHEIGPGNFSLPSGVAVTRDGRIWVSDEIRNHVQVFSAEGIYLGVVGGWGVEPGEFRYPTALATDGTSHLVVAERVGARFQLLSIK